MFKAISSVPRRIFAPMKRYPIASFFVLVALLFGIIALTHFLRAPKPEEAPVPAEKKTSEIFSLGQDTAFLSVPGEARKDGATEIVALSSGIVTNISVQAGQKVGAGQVLFELTDDYQSGIASLEKEVAKNDAELARELADIDKKIFELEEKRINRDDTLTNTEEDIALRQLKQDRETRRITLENNELNLAIALRNDAVLKPKTLISGTVESVKVRRGEFVPAGTVLATIKGSGQTGTLEAMVSRKTLALFDPSKPSTISLDGKVVEIIPAYFSQEATENGLYSILFALPESGMLSVTDREFLTIRLPLKSESAETFLIPIDSAYQDGDRAWVLVEKDGTAETKEVVLGNIYGSFAEVLSGLETGSRIILNRSVISGDSVTLR